MDPGSGLSALEPRSSVRLPSPYGGGDFLTELVDSAGGVMTNAETLALFSSRHAVWGIGPRAVGSERSGSLPGTTSHTYSRRNGIDCAFVVNTRSFNGGPKTEDDFVNSLRVCWTSFECEGLPGARKHFPEWGTVDYYPIVTPRQKKRSLSGKLDIRAVARHASVSIATVSRTINGIPTVGPELAKRVWKAIEELDYYPNTQARSLVSGRSRLLAWSSPKSPTRSFRSSSRALRTWLSRMATRF